MLQPLLHSQVYPWMLIVYTHTLSIEAQPPTAHTVWHTLGYLPALGRRPTVYRMAASLPPNSTTTLSFAYEAPLLRLHEYGPEPHRGVEIPSSVMYVCNSANKHTHHDQPVGRGHCGDGRHAARVYTDPILVPVPLPDFSMPYNTVMIASAVMAMSLIGFTQIGLADEPKTPASESIVARIRKALFRGRKEVEPDKKDS